MSPAKPTPAQARDRRAKIAVVVLAVVLVGALVIQGPKLLKMIHKSSPPVSASTIDAAPIGSTTAASQATPGASALPSALTTTVASQLTGLGRFALKDPFHAQNVTTTTTSLGSATPASTNAAGAGATTTTTTAASGSSKPVTTPAKAPATTPAATTTTPALSVPFTVAPAAPPNAAVLLTNGRREIIPVGQDFPSEAPLFKLNAVRTQGKHESSIRVSVLGGSFTGGAQTVPIEMGKTITFNNESDGTRYVVKVLRLTTVTNPVGPSATPAGTTPVAATTPATATTGGAKG